MNIDVQMNPGFKEVDRSRKRYIVMKGSAGSGKSVDTAQNYILRLMQDPGRNLLCVRKADVTNRDSTFAELQGAIFRMFGEQYKRYWHINSSNMIMECKINRNQIIFRGVNDEKQREKLKSITFKRGKLTDVWIEEATEITQADFEIIDDRLRGELPEGQFYQIRMTFNPVSAYHWIKRVFFDRSDPDVLTHQSTYEQKLDIEEYGRKAAKYVKEKDFSDQANEEMRLYNATMKINRLELLKANIGLEMVSGFDELQKYFDKTLTQQTIEEFRRQAGILGNSVQENGKMARAIVDASFHNATYSDRIWMYQDMLKAELDKLLKTGLIQGKNPRELAVHLQKRFGASREDAERLMVTELARVQTEAQKQSYIRNGFEEYTYVACGNADVCERCQALDGKHFKVQDMMPGTNAPPMHPRCHCSTAAYEDSAEYEKWLDFLEQGGTTEEWEASKNRKARYKDNEGIFQTLDGRSKGRDVIKPRNIMKEMKKSSIGTEMLEYLQENDIQIKVWYGVDVDEGLDGLFEDGEINIYADNTKTVRETAITVIHEATHAKINKPNTKSQELQCYVNEYRHQNIELTEKVLQDIINHINDKYPNLKWE